MQSFTARLAGWVEPAKNQYICTGVNKEIVGQTF